MLRTRELLAVVVLLSGAKLVGATQCIVPDDNLPLPPVGGEYRSPDEVFEIIDGLPAGTVIEIEGALFDFIGLPEFIEIMDVPGGSFVGGNRQTFYAQFEMSITGTGLLGGFNRSITMWDVAVETHTAPRTQGDAVQTFDTEMFSLHGGIFGDPDFDLLTLRAGAEFGLPSPGQTTLTEIGGGAYNVDSFFDITYEIDFQGAPGGILDGLAGTTTGSIRIQAGEPIPEPSTFVLAALGLLGLLAWLAGRRVLNS